MGSVLAEKDRTDLYPLFKPSAIRSLPPSRDCPSVASHCVCEVGLIRSEDNTADDLAVTLIHRILIGIRQLRHLLS